jgi:alpha-amylase/alpha-mannosidase (GH57 family)
MSKIYLCFLWHMHQPLYKDLISGQYRLPWTRLHALKDYYGMVRILAEYPHIRQTFNVVPSMMVQVEEYATGQAADPFLRCASKPAEEMTPEEQEFLLRYGFQANPAHMIYRFPRYGELYDDWRSAGRDVVRARRFFNAQALRDLQVLSQLAWFDEEYLATDAEVCELVTKGRQFTLEDQVLVGKKEAEILNKVLPVYRDFAASGQIELSTTPFYHPILPLLCDTNIAEVSHPYVPLPSRFAYPQDARLQIERARQYMTERFNEPPVGMWPSEGSVSDEVLRIAAEAGFLWTATDEGVLARTLNSHVGVTEKYRPYLWRQNGRQIQIVFRDRFLSDLIGFVYSRMGAKESAEDFLNRVRENCRPLLSAGRDALVPVILDGENAWEYYQNNGRPFLRELYERISVARDIEALTMSEALLRMEPQSLERIFPGSWINANFDIWIGAEEDNRAWEYLLRARQTYEEREQSASELGLTPEMLRLACEELLIAEGSDWCWWYGPEHDSANRPEFDQLYRDHLANVYRALGLSPPDELSQPILKAAIIEFHALPSGPIHPVIDGEVTSFFEWLGAGQYRINGRSGAMHGQRYLIRELYYGSDGINFYLRLDFETLSPEMLEGIEVRVVLQRPSTPPLNGVLRLRLEEELVRPVEIRLPNASSAVPVAEYAFKKVLEIRVAVASLGLSRGEILQFQVSLWRDNLPLGAVPQQGWLECCTTEPVDWPV